MTTMADDLSDVVEAIDSVFGDGFAEKNPNLVGSVFGGEQISAQLKSIAMWIKYLGNGDAATTMGALEALGMHLGEKMSSVTEAIASIAEPLDHLRDVMDAKND